MGLQLRRGVLVLAWLIVCSPLTLTAQLARTDGVALSSGGVPTVNSCGIDPTVTGTDSAGTINVGSGVVTTCQLQFSVNLMTAPVCVLTSSSSAIGVGVASSTSQLSLVLSATLGGGKLFYHCAGI